MNSSRSRLVAALAIAFSLYMLVAVFYALREVLLQGHWLALGAMAAAVALIWLLTRLQFKGAIALLLAASFSAQVIWGGWLDPQPFGEFGTLWHQARQLAVSFDIDVLYSSASPSAVGLYAVFIALFGEDLYALRMVSAVLWTLQAFMVWQVARQVPELRRHAIASAAVLGLSPGVIVFSSLPSAEGVFGLFAMGAVYLLLTHHRRGLFVSAALAGMFSAIAFLCKPVAIAYAIGLLIVLGVAILRARDLHARLILGGAVATCLAGFALGVAPQVLLNYEKEQQFSIAPAPAIGYQLLLGTNRDTGGSYSLKDLERAGFVGPEKSSLMEADRAARQIAWQRVSRDPLGFAWFAMTQKMRRLWGSERELLDWSLSSSVRRDVPQLVQARIWAPVLVDGFYLAILALALAGAVRLALNGGRVQDPARWLLILGVLGMLASAHLMLEVRERYHLAFTPMLALLVPLALVSSLPRTPSRMRANVGRRSFRFRRRRRASDPAR
ncbi:MAG: glycosyltransferase family 39 protein [Neomegalonema sp.]|nr:glycosyltransferase family 39 protein [Neomegalonema sp.]